MRINHNIAALNTYNKLSANTAATSKSLEKLSSGLKINRAGDNAAGLAISEKMRGQISGLDTASANANDGISLIQTAEGALNETHSILQRMRELAVQSSNDTNTDADRGEIQKEIDTLTKEVDRISTDTEFNTQKLLNGEKATTVDTKGSTIIKKATVEGEIKTGTYTGTVAITNASVQKSDFTQTKTLTDPNSDVSSYTSVGTSAGTYSGVVKAMGSTLAGGTMAATSGNTTTFSEALKLDAGTYTITASSIGDGGNDTYTLTDSDGKTVSTGTVASGGTAVNFGGTTLTLGTAAGASGDASTFTVTHGYSIDGSGTVASAAQDSASKLAVTIAANSTVGDTFSIKIGALNAPTTDMTKTDLAKGSYQLVVSAYNGVANTATLTLQDSKGNAVLDENGNAYTQAGVDTTAAQEIGGIAISASTITGDSTLAFQVNTEMKASVALKDSVGTVSDGIKFEFNDTVKAGDSVTVEVNAENAMKFQIGANEGQSTSLSINAMGSKDLGIDKLDLTTQDGADAAITSIDGAITSVSSERAKLGAVQNRLEHTINNLGTSSENLSSAESRIRDVDMAKEMMNFTKNNILSQAAQSMLAQANQQPQTGITRKSCCSSRRPG